MNEKRLTHKEIADILGPHTRDLVNQNIALQTRIAAFEQLRDAVNQASGLITRAAGLAEQATALEAEIESKQKTLASMEERARVTTAGYKPQMLELDERAKVLASRESEVAAREQRVALREERIKTISGHLSSLSEIES